MNLAKRVGFSTVAFIAMGIGRPVLADTALDSCLPFAMPSLDALFNSPKKVFAHYFYPFPLTLQNKVASEDYYNTQHLSRNGESGKWAANGGYLRQRPLGVDVNTSPDWQL